MKNERLEITLCGRAVADFRDEADLMKGAAARVAELDAMARRAASEAVSAALAAGAILLAVRDRLPHGTFLLWVSTNCNSVSSRTAQNYMRLAEAAANEAQEGVADGAPRALIGDRSLTQLYQDYGIVRREASASWGGRREGAGRPAKGSADGVEAALDAAANYEPAMWAAAQGAIATLGDLDRRKDFLRRLSDEHLAAAARCLADLSKKAGELLSARLARRDMGLQGEEMDVFEAAKTAEGGL